ncbi:MAG: hypothetical protein WCV55_01765 [Candidatus Paceibacterota bacterium]
MENPSSISEEEKQFVLSSSLVRFFKRLESVRKSPENRWFTGEKVHHEPNDSECDAHLRVQCGVVQNELTEFRRENHLTVPSEQP